MKIVFNTLGFIGSLLLAIYGLLVEGYLKGPQLVAFSHHYQWLLYPLTPAALLIGYYLAEQFKEKPAPPDNGNNNMEDLLQAAYGRNKSVEIETPRIRRIQ